MISTPLRWFALVVSIGLTLSLAACSTTAPMPPSPTSAAPSQGWSAFLNQYQWQLTSATDRSDRPLGVLAEATAVQARFSADARLNITGGCNAMSGGYQVTDAGQLTVAQMVSTRRACTGSLMQVDATMSSVVAQALQLRVDNATATAPRLTMRAADGSTLVWTGRVTPEARYGTPTTVFLEVAPQRVACTHPLMPSMLCMQVREIQYNAQGLVSAPPGAWQNLYQPIEGYTHADGLRQVLRLKRYQRPAPVPADASSTILVLDMVVQTEAVPK